MATIAPKWKKLTFNWKSHVTEVTVDIYEFSIFGWHSPANDEKGVEGDRSGVTRRRIEKQQQTMCSRISNKRKNFDE